MLITPSFLFIRVHGLRCGVPELGHRSGSKERIAASFDSRGLEFLPVMSMNDHHREFDTLFFASSVP